MVTPRVTDTKDDPIFPVKPVVGGVVAVLTWLVTSNVFDNETVNGLITLVLGMIGTYLAPNPKVRRSDVESPPDQEQDDGQDDLVPDLDEPVEDLS